MVTYLVPQNQQFFQRLAPKKLCLTLGGVYMEAWQPMYASQLGYSESRATRLVIDKVKSVYLIRINFLREFAQRPKILYDNYAQQGGARK